MSKTDDLSQFFGFPVDWATFPLEVPQLYIEVFGAIMGGPAHFSADLLDFETDVLFRNLSTLDGLLVNSSAGLGASYEPLRELVAKYIEGLGDVRFGAHHPDIGRPNMHGRPVTVGDRNFIPFVRGLAALVHRLSSDLAAGRTGPGSGISPSPHMELDGYPARPDNPPAGTPDNRGNAGRGGPETGGSKAKSGPPETKGSSSRGSDYRESGGPRPSKGKTEDDKPKEGAPRLPTSGEQGRIVIHNPRTNTDEEYLSDGSRVVRYPDGSKEIVPPGGMSSAERAEKEQEAKEKADKEKAEKERKESDEKKDEKPPEKKEEEKKDDEDENAQQNTTRGNPLDDDGGDDHESRRFTHHYMPPETRALFAFTELGRALAPKGPPLPGSGGPTDRGWTPFRARTAAAAPPESAAYGREALKNAFADGAIGGALAGRPYHGPTDDGGQVPVAADARTSGDESDADAKASRDSVRQMIWNKFAAPRIRYARRMR